MNNETRYTVIGAGHGGKAMAAHLALMGFPVTLFTGMPERVAAIKERGGIQLKSYNGGPHGLAKLLSVTSDMSQALEQAEVIMVVVPPSAHADIARRVAPHLHDGQIIVLHSGRTFGAIEFSNVLYEQLCPADVALAEVESLIYDSRSEGPTETCVLCMAEAVPLAALPATRTQLVLDALRTAYPQFVDAVTVLHTGLNNFAAVFHPALVLLNAGRIESSCGDFQFYIDGITSAVAHVLEALDRERVAVASGLGIHARTAMEWLKMAYQSTGANLTEAIHNNPSYWGITAPCTLNHDYVSEDVPMSLVPMVSLGQRYGVSVSAMDTIIRLACIVHQTDYWHRGRTLDKLGIEHLSADELTRYVNEGVLD